MHQNMPISLFKTLFDHFIFIPPPESFKGLYWNCVICMQSYVLRRSCERWVLWGNCFAWTTFHNPWKIGIVGISWWWASNSIFTMMGAPDKKLFSDVFFQHTLTYLCVKFQVCLTCPTGFLPTNTTFFTNILWEYFFPDLSRVFDQPEVEFSKSGQNWANTRPLLLKTLGPSKYSL